MPSQTASVGSSCDTGGGAVGSARAKNAVTFRWSSSCFRGDVASMTARILATSPPKPAKTREALEGFGSVFPRWGYSSSGGGLVVAVVI